MLTIASTDNRHDCTGLTRRNFLRIGGLGLAGCTLADLFACRAHASQRPYVQDKSVVFLYLGGGPSQIETFDPKMDAPVEYRSLTGAIQTRLTGVNFGGTFPKLAALADRLAVVRSFVHGNANHDGGMGLFTGLTPTKAALGSIYARLTGAANRQSGMPANIFLSPMSVGHALPGGLQSFYYNGPTTLGSLPAANAVLHPMLMADTAAKAPASGLLADLQLRLPLERLTERRELLTRLDGLRRRFDNGGVEAADQFQQQAYDVLLKGVSEAFDLSREDPRTVERYDTSHFKTPAPLIKMEKNGKMTAQSQPVLGKQLLLARRLVEAGCGFVTVGTNDWDMHGNFNSYPIGDGMELMGGALDQAVSAFLTDLEERGLSDQVLLVITGEMGRTPRISMDKATKRPGRDHWANLGALVLAGGGLRTGQVIGASDKVVGKPASAPITPKQLMATIWHTLFNIGELRLVDGLPADLARAVTESEPIRELVG